MESCITTLANDDNFVSGHNIFFNIGTTCACENRALVQRGDFQVQKFKVAKSTNKLKFVAVLDQDDKDTFAILYANIEGDCYEVYADKNSILCGIAPALISACLKDKNINVNPLKRREFQVKGAKVARLCAHIKHVIFKVCEEDKGSIRNREFPPLAEDYLKQALLSGYDKLISFNHNCSEQPEFLNMNDAIDEYSKNPKMFIQFHGIDWFFCASK